MFAAKELTKQEKTVAILELAMEQSGDALAAYNEENLDLAAKTKIVSGQLQDLGAKIGTNLLPIWHELLDGFIEFIAWMERILVKIRDFIRESETMQNIINGVKEAVKLLWEAISDLIGWLKDFIIDTVTLIRENDNLREILIALGLAIGTVTAGFIAWKVALTAYNAVLAIYNVLTAKSTLLILGIVTAVTAVIAIFRNWERITRKFTELWERLTTKIGNAFNNRVVEPIKSGIERIKDFFRDLRDFVFGIFESIGNFFGGIGDFFSNLLPFGNVGSDISNNFPTQTFAPIPSTNQNNTVNINITTTAQRITQSDINNISNAVNKQLGKLV